MVGDGRQASQYLFIADVVHIGPRAHLSPLSIFLGHTSTRSGGGGSDMQKLKCCSRPVQVNNRMLSFNGRLTRNLLLASLAGLIYVVWLTDGLSWFNPIYYRCSQDDMNKEQLNQDHPCVIEVLRQKFLHPPSKDPISLQDPAENANPSMGQAQIVLNYLNNKENGFFVECGALDGETRSNTLFMERHLNWQGVLIEGDPKNFEKVLSKNRKAWTAQACLSLAPYPTIVSFRQNFNLGRISQDEDEDDDSPLPKAAPSSEVQVQCFPFFSILQALNRTEVDYFSLDIEGDELSVLKTIPWDRVNIHTLSVEFIHDKEGKDEIRKFMEAQGYKVIAEVTHPQRLANDFIFVKSQE